MEMRMTTDLETALPAEIGFNFDELKAELTERLQHYNALVVTEDAIKEAKADLANLRKLKDAIETRRKEVKRQCMAPYNAFEAQVKELTRLIDAPVAAINGQIKAFDEQEKAKKYEEITAAYEKLVQENLREIIPLNRILDPKWLNKGTTMKSIGDAIATIANRTKIDMLYLESATAPEYLTAVRAKYNETLSIDAAMDYRDKLIATEQAYTHQEEPIAQRTAQRMDCNTYEHHPENNPATPAQERREEEKVYLLRLEFQLSKEQANALKRFLVDNNIKHTKI